VIQLQLHGGKNPIVLYWEMKLQADLHVSNELLKLHRNGSTSQVSLPGSQNFL